MNRTRGDEYKGKLQVGQKVYCGLYGGREGLIFEIKGEQRPDTIRELGGGIVMGGCAMLSVVFEDGTISRGIPESIVRGVQWDIFDEVTPEAVEGALTHAEAREIVKKKAAEEHGEALHAERERIINAPEYKDLTKASEGGKLWGATLAASNIRKELKKAFPKIKFSVRSEKFSGGDSVTVEYTDAVPRETVEKIINKYEEGTFDGMTDCYNYDHDNVWVRVYGGTKYLRVERRISDEINKAAAADLAARFGETFNGDAGNQFIKAANEWLSTLVYRALRKVDLSAGYKKELIDLNSY
jgi:hypothetical protein